MGLDRKEEIPTSPFLPASRPTEASHWPNLGACGRELGEADPGVAGRHPSAPPWGLTPWLPCRPRRGAPRSPSNSQSSVRPALSDPCCASVIVQGPARRAASPQAPPRGAHVSLRYDPGVSPLSGPRGQAPEAVGSCLAFGLLISGPQVSGIRCSC